MPGLSCATNPCSDLTRYSGRSYEVGGHQIYEAHLERPGYGPGSIPFDMSTVEGRQGYFAFMQRTRPERQRALDCDAKQREAQTWFGIDAQNVVRASYACRPSGEGGVVWLGQGADARAQAHARSRGERWQPEASPQPCGITGWELRAREKARAEQAEVQARQAKVAADAAWLQGVKAKEAAANAAAAQSGVMQERRTPGLVTRVRLRDGGQVSAAVADKAAEAAATVLPFLRSDKMVALLAGVPQRNAASSPGASIVSAWRPIASGTSPASREGSASKGWFEPHELVLELSGEQVLVRYHSNAYPTSLYALRNAGEGRLADALATLASLKVSLHLEPC